MCVCVCVYVCMYVCVYICMYVCMYVCICVCIYILYTGVARLGGSRGGEGGPSAREIDRHMRDKFRSAHSMTLGRRIRSAQNMQLLHLHIDTHTHAHTHRSAHSVSAEHAAAAFRICILLSRESTIYI